MATGIHRGHSTHHQLQSMSPCSFMTMNAIVRSPLKVILHLVLLILSFLFGKFQIYVSVEVVYEDVPVEL